MSAAGAAYIFEKDSTGNWNFKQKLVAYDRYPGDTYGGSVDIFGNTAIVGSPHYHNNKGVVNTVYVFARDEQGNWNQKTALAPSNDSDCAYYFSTYSQAFFSDFSTLFFY